MQLKPFLTENKDPFLNIIAVGVLKVQKSRISWAAFSFKNIHFTDMTSKNS